MHPAKDTSQTAAAGKAGGDSAVDAGAIELRVFAAVATADNILGSSCKFQGVKGRKSGLQVPLVCFTKGSHKDYYNSLRQLLVTV